MTVENELESAKTEDVEDLEEEDEEEDEEDEEPCLLCGRLKSECDCTLPACPICGETGWDGEVISLEYLDCDHLVAGWDEGGFSRPIFEKDPFPDDWDCEDWTEEELKTAFGEAEPLVYHQYLEGNYELRPEEFMEELLSLVPGMDYHSYYSSGSGMMGWGAIMYCADDAGKARIQELAALLETGFKHLEKLRSEKAGTAEQRPLGLKPA